MEKSLSSEHTRPGRVLGNARPYVVLFLFLLAGIWVSKSNTLASPLHSGPAQAAAGTPSVPAAVGTQAPSIPQANTTKTGPVVSPPDALATRSAGLTPVQPANGATSAATSSPSSGGFPWVWLLLLVPLLAALAYALTRSRSTRTVVSTTAGASALPGVAATTSTTTSTTTGTVMPAAAGGATAVEGPSVVCPNCSTSNTIDENFCHECGQDLRATRAQMVAATQDVVTDDTPYFETLDRVEEQLEYVLSRARVTIGSASGNDIVVDRAFRNWQSVSPMHAELRREGAAFVVVDRSSEGGTYVNDARVTEASLTDGSVVRLGQVRFIFHAPA